jgi:hypothetical protein
VHGITRRTSRNCAFHGHEFVYKRLSFINAKIGPWNKFCWVSNRTEKALLEMDEEKIRKSLLQDQCDWINAEMNVPCASHMGSGVTTMGSDRENPGAPNPNGPNGGPQA